MFGLPSSPQQIVASQGGGAGVITSTPKKQQSGNLLKLTWKYPSMTDQNRNVMKQTFRQLTNFHPVDVTINDTEDDFFIYLRPVFQKNKRNLSQSVLTKILEMIDPSFLSNFSIQIINPQKSGTPPTVKAQHYVHFSSSLPSPSTQTPSSKRPDPFFQTPADVRQHPQQQIKFLLRFGIVASSSTPLHLHLHLQQQQRRKIQQQFYPNNIRLFLFPLNVSRPKIGFDPHQSTSFIEVELIPGNQEVIDKQSIRNALQNMTGVKLTQGRLVRSTGTPATIPVKRYS